MKRTHYRWFRSPRFTDRAIMAIGLFVVLAIGFAATMLLLGQLGWY
jgi:hypothetical protein